LELHGSHDHHLRLERPQRPQRKPIADAAPAAADAPDGRHDWNVAQIHDFVHKAAPASARPRETRIHGDPMQQQAFKNQRGGALVWILITLIVAGGAFAVYWFVLRGGGGGATAAVVNRAIPAEAKMLVGFDPQTVLNSAALGEVLKTGGMTVDGVKSELAKANIKPEALKAVVVGFGDNMQDSVAIFAGDIDATALKGAIGAVGMMSPDAASIANAMQFESLDGGLVIAGNSNLYQKSLSTAKGQGAAGLDANLEKVLGAIDRGAAVWAAGLLPEEAAEGFKGAGPLLGGSAPTHGAISIDVGSDLKIKVALLFPGGDASKMASTIEALMKMAPMGQLPDGVGDVLKSLELSGSGEVLKASVTVPQALIGKLAKSGM
jgi:hypothetical protein